MDTNKIVSGVLREYADKLDTGTCVISLEDALNIVSQIAHISMSKQDVADRYGVSTKTIERKEKDGILPPSHLVIPSKKLWYLDEIIENEKYL